VKPQSPIAAAWSESRRRRPGARDESPGRLGAGRTPSLSFTSSWSSGTIYDDAFDYPTVAKAIEAMRAWNGTGDAPVGWVRNFTAQRSARTATPRTSIGGHETLVAQPSRRAPRHFSRDPLGAVRLAHHHPGLNICSFT
jgi:hypothetical protein